MSFVINYVKQTVTKTLDSPLETMSLPNNRLRDCVDKLVAAVAIALFTVISVGTYLIYAYKFFENRRIENTKTEFNSAVESNDLNKVKLLFSKAPFLKEHLNTSNTPLLHSAIHDGQKEMASLLISHGADIYGSSRMGNTMAIATYRKDFEMVKFLVEQHKYDLKKDELFFTPAINMVMSEIPAPECFRFVNYLVRMGSIVNTDRYITSILGSVANHWEKHPKEAKETMILLMNNGAELRAEEEASLPPEAVKFINNFPWKKKS